MIYSDKQIEEFIANFLEMDYEEYDNLGYVPISRRELIELLKRYKATGVSRQIVPTDTEKESRKVAQHIIWLNQKVNHYQYIPKWIALAAEGYFGDAIHCDRLTDILCSMCKEVTENVIHNGTEPDAKSLADWWDNHRKFYDN